MHAERLGDVSLLYLRVADAAAPLALRVDGGSALGTGELVTLRLHAEQCHLFDAEGRAFERTVALPH